MRNRSWKINGISLLLLGTLLATVVWAFETLEITTYYPPSPPDPFHTTRLTVGRGYLALGNGGATPPPANSLIVQGPVGIGTSSPALPLEIAPQGAFNAAVKWWGTAGNRYFYLDNNLGNLQFVSQNAGGESPKLFVSNTGKLGVRTAAAPVAASPVMEIGTLGGADASLRLLGNANGAARFPSFSMENHQASLQWVTDDGLGTVTSNPLVSPFGFLGVGIAADPADGTAYPLTVGTLNDSMNAAVRWRGRTGGKYFYLENNTGDVVLMMENSSGGGATERFRVTNSGNVGIGTSVPAGRLHVAGDIAISGNMASGNIAVSSFPGVTAEVPAGGTGKGIFMESAGGEAAYGFSIRSGTNQMLLGEEVAGGAVAARMTASGGIAPPAFNASGDPLAPGTPGQVGIHTLPLSNFYQLSVVGLAHADVGVVGGFNPNVVGTTTSALTVYGNVFVRDGWSSSSSAQIKTDIRPFTPQEASRLLTTLANLPLYRYRLKDEYSEKTAHVGILAEEVPRELSAQQGQAVNSSSYLAALIAAIQAQQVEIEKLRVRVESLRKKRMGARR